MPRLAFIGGDGVSAIIRDDENVRRGLQEALSMLRYRLPGVTWQLAIVSSIFRARRRRRQSRVASSRPGAGTELAYAVVCGVICPGSLSLFR